MFFKVSLVVLPEQNSLKWKQHKPPTTSDKIHNKISKNRIKDPKNK